MIRFTCPRDDNHTNFYLRRSYSEAFKVSASGGIATKETKNSHDCEGDSFVFCADCERDRPLIRTEALDAKSPLTDLVEDESL